MLTVDELERAGIDLAPEEFERLVVDAVRQLPTAIASADPRRDLTSGDIAALTRGGFDLAPLAASLDDPLARTAAEYSALVVTSLPVPQVARLLGVDASRVRQRLAKRTLYGLKLRDGWHLPSFQFDERRGGRLLPGIEQVLPVLDPALHPVAVYRWFTKPNPDLLLDDTAVSPRDWLRGGGDPAKVVALW